MVRHTLKCEAITTRCFLEDSFSEKQKIPGELPYKTLLTTPLDQRHLFVS